MAQSGRKHLAQYGWKPLAHDRPKDDPREGAGV